MVRTEAVSAAAVMAEGSHEEDKEQVGNPDGRGLHCEDHRTGEGGGAPMIMVIMDIVVVIVSINLLDKEESQD